MFEHWWCDEGRSLTGETKKNLAEFAYEAGRIAGMAMAGNYTADTAEMPKEINFHNGRRVKLRVSHDGTPYLTVGEF